MCRVPIAPAVVALMLFPGGGCGGDRASGEPGAAPGDGGLRSGRPGSPDSGEGPADGGHPAPTADAASPGACPPAGPFGVTAGFQLPDITLTDCDGRPVRLHDLCEARAAWMFIFAGW